MCILKKSILNYYKVVKFLNKYLLIHLLSVKQWLVLGKNIKILHIQIGQWILQRNAIYSLFFVLSSVTALYQGLMFDYILSYITAIFLLNQICSFYIAVVDKNPLLFNEMVPYAILFSKKNYNIKK